MKRDYSIFKKPIFWLLFLFSGYILVGFFLIPYLLKDLSIKYVQKELNHTLKISKIYFNPFSFDFSINNLSLENNSSKLVSFKRFYINFEPFKSILEKHIDFKELILTDANISVEIYKNGELNFNALSKNSETEDINKSETSLFIPKIKLHKLVIFNSNINFENKQNGLNFEINDINSSYYNLSTYKNSLAAQRLEFKINKNTPFKLGGGFYFDPMKLYGEISIENIHPNQFLAPIKDKLNFDPKDSTANLFLGYEVDLTPKLNLKIENTNFQLKDLGIIKKNKELTTLKNFEIKDLNLKYPKQKLNITNITLEKFYADLIFDKKYQTNFIGLFKQNDKNEPQEETNGSSKPWDINIKNINLQNSKVNITDTNRDFKTDIKDININLSDFNLKENSLFDYAINLKVANAPLKSKGKFSIKPFSLYSSNDLEKFELNRFQKYIDEFANIDLKSADFYTKAKVDIKDEVIKIASTHSLKNLKITNKDNIILLSTNELDINNLTFNTKTNQLNIKNIDIIKPFAYMHIDKDQTLNLANLVKPSNKSNISSKKEDKKDNNPLSYNIDNIALKNASMKFVDLSLPLPFAADIKNLKGDIARIDSKIEQPSKIDLEGNINKYGYVKIGGTITPQNLKRSSKVSMQFKNVNMKNLTPYTGKFLGKKIDSGKLSLDLTYSIIKSKLEASNSVVINRIKLGGDINSTEAMNLPLSLAIAILEDSNGVIDLDIPVTGNVDDPQFAVAPIVFEALGNILIKVLASPFSILGSLLGIEPDKLKTIEFESGYAKLTPPTIEKLDNLIQLFKKRPNISIAITPAYNNADITIVKNLTLEKEIEEALKKSTEKKELKYRIVLETLLKKYDSETSLEDLQKASQTKIEDKTVLDSFLYYQNIKSKILEKLTIPDNELKTLALTRAKNAQKYIDEKGFLNRINIDENINFDESDKKWLELQMSVKVREK